MTHCSRGLKSKISLILCPHFKQALCFTFCQTKLQDGKTLPEGPVVISPDGLFPSLFREGKLVVSPVNQFTRFIVQKQKFKCQVLTTEIQMMSHTRSLHHILATKFCLCRKFG